MNWRVFVFWCVLILIAATRVVFSLDRQPTSVGPCEKQSVNGIGTVVEEPERRENGQIVIILAEELIPVTAGSDSSRMKMDVDASWRGSEAGSCPASVLIRLKTNPYPRLSFGDRISFSGKLSKPFNFKSETGRAFDYIGYLAKDGIFHEIKSAKAELSPDESDHGIWERASGILFDIKRRFVSNLERALGEPHAALAAGLVVGEKSALGKDLLDDFRTVGLIHIVVLSGFNITVVGDALRKLLSRLPRVWGILVGGIGIALFGVMVGGGATVVRSCFMAGVALSADLIRRDYSVIRALIFAGLIMIIQNPSILFHDPSFQLSFLATFGLILLSGPVEERLTLVPERFGLRGIFSATIATQIFVSPYILYMMGSVSIVGLAANILVLPIIPLTMLAVFVTGAFGFISAATSQFFGWITYFLLEYELQIVGWFSSLPFASASFPPFSGWWVAGFYVVFLIVFYWNGLVRFFISRF